MPPANSTTVSQNLLHRYSGKPNASIITLVPRFIPLHSKIASTRLKQQRPAHTLTPLSAHGVLTPALSFQSQMRPRSTLSQKRLAGDVPSSAMPVQKRQATGKLIGYSPTDLQVSEQTKPLPTSHMSTRVCSSDISQAQPLMERRLSLNQRREQDCTRQNQVRHREVQVQQEQRARQVALEEEHRSHREQEHFRREQKYHLQVQENERREKERVQKIAAIERERVNRHKVALRNDTNHIYYAYLESLDYFPLEPGQKRNPYLLKLLVNKPMPRDLGCELSIAITYARKNWSLYREYPRHVTLCVNDAKIESDTSVFKSWASHDMDRKSS